jgi:hypothetical protein
MKNASTASPAFRYRRALKYSLQPMFLELSIPASRYMKFSTGTKILSSLLLLPVKTPNR